MTDALVNQNKVTILRGDPAKDFWLQGVVNRYPDHRFTAKIYDVGSVFGIEGGRISKLHVWRYGEEVISYERGWDQRPKSWRDRQALREILAGFPDEHEKAQASKLPDRPQRYFAFARKTFLQARDRSKDHYER